MAGRPVYGLSRADSRGGQTAPERARARRYRRRDDRRSGGPSRPLFRGGRAMTDAGRGRLVVTGSSGFVGSELRRAAGVGGLAPIGVDIVPTGRAAREPFVRADIRSRSELQPVLDA